MSAQVQSAQLSWNAQGTPLSEQFDDVYFSNNNGLEETRYVFLQNNRLPERWSGYSRPTFVVAESGFGTGLNFLACWQAFRQFRQAQPQRPLQRLHFISFEKFPLTHDDLARALAAWPELNELAGELLGQYPLPLSGCQRLLFDRGEVSLDLWIGDIHDSLIQIAPRSEGLVDCWFLDGFAPGKNPEMWTQSLFDAMARLARRDATFATFTAAGFVRRGLQASGFDVDKCKGFGSKREMLRGNLPHKAVLQPDAPWYARPAAATGQPVSVLGAGLAGAATALALTRRGIPVRLLSEGSSAADGASGNRQGALYPLLNGAHDPLSQFYAAAFGFARRQIDRLLDTGHAIAHDWCGVLQLGYDGAQQKKLAAISANPAFPAELVTAVSAEQASALCGLPLPHGGVFYPAGGWLSPADLTRALLAEAGRTGKLEIQYHSRIEALERSAQGWLLKRTGSADLPAQTVVIACGHQSPAFAQLAPLPLYPVRGQISHLKSNTTLEQLHTVLCYEGYLTPAHQQQHCIGASYDRNQTDLAPRDADQTGNLEKLRRSLAGSEWTDALPVPDGQRVGIRCASRDHFPMVGQVPDLAATVAAYEGIHLMSEHAWPLAPGHAGLYLLGALGSRGLCSGLLAAELLAGQIAGEPLPLARPLLDALNPNRLWIRRLLKGKPVMSWGR